MSPLRILLATCFLAAALLNSVFASTARGADESFVLAFGSCLHQDLPQPIWRAVHAARPDVFVFTGDNFYARTRDPDELARHYRTLASSRALTELKQNTRVLAVWDDNDYGESDAGADYPLRELSHRMFRETFELAPDSRAWRGPGIYDSQRLEWRGYRIQILLLDTRSFRDPLGKHPLSPNCPYRPPAATAPDASLLGADQWTWLDDRLREPADVRVLVSSVQVLPDRHCWEKWANFPDERRRLLELLQSPREGRLVIVSGDRHFADISRLPGEAPNRHLYEITASGLNTARVFGPEPNRFRVVDDRFASDHFGLILLSEQAGRLNIQLQIRDVYGTPVLEYTLPPSKTDPPETM